ncbi:GNAT family N-acetyltransferase [Bacillus haimaensis]|uniref:GNAT family N-acetyltransferase n=1 Tax=Bacillus haimaensis TaxID=3160967 RepID=UPI003AA90B4A
MEIYLEMLEEKHFQAPLQFEKENREYFEKSVPGRGETYYHFETFTEIQRTLIKEQIVGKSYFYMVKNLDGVIIARVNKVDLDKEERCAHVRYRVGEAASGKGVAKKAVQLLMSELREKGITRLYAKTTLSNKGSQRVLENNGFVKVDLDECEDIL